MKRSTSPPASRPRRVGRVAALLALALAAPLGFGQPASVAQDAATKQQMQALGEKYPTATALYKALKAESGNQPFRPSDWSGLWTRGKGGLQFDPDLPQNTVPTTPKLTPAGTRRVQEKVAQLKTTGGEFDPLSSCLPPGTPRWFSEPFLREFVVTKDQVWFMNEMVNDVRRIYTDGREHVPDLDGVPSWNGDSIGVWSGDTLIAHTNQLKAGQYQRGLQPDYSDKVEVVERWRRVDAKNIVTDLWVYDPPNLAQPWYTHQIYTQLGNPDRSLRIRYWDCHENDNNQIIVRDDGTSQFKNFGFVKDNAAASSDPAVKGAARPASAPK